MSALVRAHNCRVAYISDSRSGGHDEYLVVVECEAAGLTKFEVSCAVMFPGLTEASIAMTPLAV